MARLIEKFDELINLPVGTLVRVDRFFYNGEKYAGVLVVCKKGTGRTGDGSLIISKEDNLIWVAFRVAGFVRDEESFYFCDPCFQESLHEFITRKAKFYVLDANEVCDWVLGQMERNSGINDVVKSLQESVEKIGKFVDRA